MFANLCALEIIRPFYLARFLHICFYLIYNKQSLGITPQTLVNNKGSRVYIIINKIYFIICTIYILSKSFPISSSRGSFCLCFCKNAMTFLVNSLSLI